MDKKSQTINTYNGSALALADKFNSLGARTSDIEEVFNFLKKDNAKVVEIGCGNGRDAAEILKWTDDYLGMDVSVGLIKLAQEKLPQVEFVVSDITTFSFPQNIDIVFAFASLIHVNKEEFKSILEKIYDVLNSPGVVRISLKYSDVYQEVTKEDEFGIRTYYHYSREDMGKIAQDFSIVKCDISNLRGQKWMEIMLLKK